MDSNSLILPGFLLLLVAMALVTRSLRLHSLRSGTLSEEDANIARVELLSFVKQQSFNPNTEVSLRPFWRKRGFGEGDRAQIISPLLAEGMLLVLVPTDFSGRTLRRAFDWYAPSLPEKVILNPQEWQRMTNGVSALTIVEQQFNDHREIHQDFSNNSGQMNIGNVQAGDASSGIAEHTGGAMQGIPAAYMVELARALRADARQIGDEGARETIDKLADDVDSAIAGPRPHDFPALVQKALTYVTLLSTALTSTATVIEKIRDIGGS